MYNLHFTKKIWLNHGQKYKTRIDYLNFYLIQKFILNLNYKNILLKTFYYQSRKIENCLFCPFHHCIFQVVV